MDSWACQFFEVDQTPLGILHLLVLYIWRATLETLLTAVGCVEMGSACARASVVVHGKLQLLACVKLVTCLETSMQPGPLGSADGLLPTQSHILHIWRAGLE